MNPQGILLRYHEIALKGGNRRQFEVRLALNVEKMLRRSLGGSSTIQTYRQHGRIVATAPWTPKTQETLKRVFGLSSFSPMRKVPSEKSALIQAALEEIHHFVARSGQTPRHFKIKTRRSDKALPETSMELDREIGAAIKASYPDWIVDLKNPEITLGIELRFEKSYLWLEKIQAQGGLPVGSNARVLTLLSGGIDSPVAAIYALRRGSASSFVHFFGTPYVGDEVLDKIKDLTRLINRYHPDPQPLYVVPFGKIQEKIALVTDPKMRTVLYRRMMVRIASVLAKKLRIGALVTGESLGQVASQTLENLTTIHAATSVPILSPLITFNKDEIIEKATAWGTYETSIRPGIDCCTLFSDRHPIIRANLASVEAQEKCFSVEEQVAEGLAGTYLVKP